MISNKAFDLRLYGYRPLQAQELGVIPHQSLQITNTPAGPTLTAVLTKATFTSLPDAYLEIGVEWWNPSTTSWVEGRDSRFAITQFESDDRDQNRTVTLTGVGVVAWLLSKAILAGAKPYNATGCTVEAALSATISVSGKTFTWSGTPVASGDRIRIKDNGKANKLATGSVWYVRNVTTNTFQISHTPTGAIKDCGASSSIKVERVRTRIVKNSHQFDKNDAVQVKLIDGSGLSEGSKYYICNPTTNTFQLATKPNGIPIEMDKGDNFTVYADVDGERTFKSTNSGKILHQLFLEARDRNWGVGLDGTQLLHSFTATADSAGNAWNSLADDPETPGTSISFQPGTPLSQILSQLMSGGYCEFYASKRTWAVTNAGTGNDKTVQLPGSVRIGRAAGSVAITRDITDLVNRVTLRGGSNVVVTSQDSADDMRWGALEIYETMSGLTTNSSANKQAKIDRQKNNVPAQTFVVTEFAQEAAYLPLVDYSRGDWIEVQIGGAWTRMRVVGWTYSKDPNGEIKVDTTLEKIKQSAFKKLATAQKASTSSISGSASSVPEPYADSRIAAGTTILSVTTTGIFDASQQPATTASIRWSPVIYDANGGDIDIKRYEIWLRAEGEFQGKVYGRTEQTYIDVSPLTPGITYAVSVRAESADGKFGEMSPEYEFVTSFPNTVPNPPTAPAVSGRLGQVRIAWDGFVIDPVAGTVAPDPGFAYVTAMYATSENGAYTQVGANMGNAGATTASGLSIGSTYWFRFVAFNTVGTVSATSASTNYTVVGVTGPDLVANSVTANSIAAGAISVDKLSLGTVPIRATPVNRVPQPPFVVSFWQKIIDGSVPGFTYRSASSTLVGLTISPSSSMSITAKDTPVPDSGKVSVKWTTSGAGGPLVLNAQVYDVYGSTVGSPLTISAPGVYTLPTGGVTYEMWAFNQSTSTNITLVTATVFEVLGNGGAGQAAEISPAGLRLYDNNGLLAVDLTTNTANYLNIVDNTSGDPVAAAVIDNQGNAAFTTVSADNYNVDGNDFILTDSTDRLWFTTLSQSQPNGSSWVRGDQTDANGSPVAVPMLDRLGRGAIYDVTWASLNGFQSSAQYIRVAQDVFYLEDGRQYQFVVQTAGVQADNMSTGDPASTGQQALGVNCYLELQINTTPNTSITSGTTIMRSVVYNNTRGYWHMPPVVYTASSNQTTVDATNRLVPANVPIYWQVNFNMSTAPSRKLNLSEFGLSRGLSIIDIGSAYPTRPANGADTLIDVTDRTTTGASSGSSSSNTTAASKTVTFTASWSRTWNNSGNNIVTGSGQYTNGNAMYQGYGASPMGSQFGFSASSMNSISGKTVTGMQLYLKNTYAGYPSSFTALLGSHNNSSAPATFASGNRNNAFSPGWGSGDGKWVSVPKAYWTLLQNGNLKGFTLGVSGSTSQYGYFAGANQSSPPKLKVTYH